MMVEMDASVDDAERETERESEGKTDRQTDRALIDCTCPDVYPLLLLGMSVASAAAKNVMLIIAIFTIMTRLSRNLSCRFNAVKRGNDSWCIHTRCAIRWDGMRWEWDALVTQNILMEAFTH